MGRDYYLDLARKGLAMPLAVDLFVHLLSDPERVEKDAAEMARVMEAAARELGTPLAVAPMDLRVERAALMEVLGAEDPQDEKTHLDEPLSAEAYAAARERIANGPLSERMRVTMDAVAAVRSGGSGLRPVGMCIGPFSLVTKMMSEVITAFYMMGSGTEPEDDESVELAAQLLDLSTLLVERYAREQARAGASAVIVCEPAANKAYISPNLMEAGSDIFERAVMAPNRRVRDAIEGAGADLILHDCGELTDEIIRLLGSLRPSVLSFGSPVDLPSAAALVPEDVVLFGNIPSKLFPQDDALPLEKVEAMCADLRARMAAIGRPFILGSECDVLFVPGCGDTIVEKARLISRKSKANGCCGGH